MPRSRFHVAIDCRVIDPLYPGIGRAMLETVGAMAHDLPASAERLSLLVGPDGPPPALTEGIGADGTTIRFVRVPARLRGAADQWVLPRVLRALRADVYHAPYYAVPAIVPTRFALTVHDLIPQLFPRYWPNPAMRRAIDLWMRHAMRRADRIIAVSESTRDDLVRLFPAVAAKTRVVPQGVAPRPTVTTGSHGADPPYLLYVGSNKPHKNLPRLVGAFARIAPEVTANLIVAGAWDERYPEARDETRRRGLGERILFERRPSDRRLDELYAGATAFTFPSVYEGFGLPVLEAMAAGLPVATSNQGSLREVAGDAALLFDPYDEDAIAQALRRLLCDGSLRSRLAQAGRARAALYPWSRTAQGSWLIYEEVVHLSGQ